MRMRTRIFGVEKFKSLLLAGSFTVLAGSVVRLADSVIAGNMLGEEALAGINLVGPFLSLISFLSGLISTGMATNYSLAMGRCDRVRAHRYFVQGVWSVVLFCGGFSLLLVFGGDWLLSFFGASEGVRNHAAGFLSFIWPLAVLEGVEMLMVALCAADGDTHVCYWSYATIFFGNIVFSVLGVICFRAFDPARAAAGCALGTVLAVLLGCCILAIHFRRKSNSLSWVRHFSLGDSWRIAKSSFGDSAAFLCDALLFLFINKFVIVYFGSALLPVVAVATAVWGFLQFFNGVGVAIQPIVTVYHGEQNTRSVRRVMRSAMGVSILEGVAFTVVFGLFPDTVSMLVGVRDPVALAQSATAVRFVSMGFVALALAGLFNSYYMFVEKPGLAGAVTVLCYLALPIACAATGSLAGANGFWAGVGLGPVVGLLITAAVVLSAVGWRRFPLLLSCGRDAKLHVFDLELTEEAIVETSRQIAALPGVPMRAALMTEEVFLAVRDRARGRRLLGEATVDLNDGVQLTLRDDGEIFDITDADQRISSLRTFLVASMMESTRGRINLVTTGFNRNVFRFQ